MTIPAKKGQAKLTYYLQLSTTIDRNSFRNKSPGMAI